MGKKEEITGAAFIDYEEEASTNEPAIKWTHNDLVKYWKRLFLKIHHGSVHWTIKEQTLLSSLLKKYSIADTGDMMQYWMESKPAKEAMNFGYFFSIADAVFQDVLKDRAEWKWEN